jgi:hypothetical protein
MPKSNFRNEAARNSAPALCGEPPECLPWRYNCRLFNTDHPGRAFVRSGSTNRVSTPVVSPNLRGTLFHKKFKYFLWINFQINKSYHQNRGTEQTALFTHCEAYSTLHGLLYMPAFHIHRQFLWHFPFKPSIVQWKCSQRSKHKLTLVMYFWIWNLFSRPVKRKKPDYG